MLMLLRVEMKCHYRSVYLTSTGRHSEKKPAETSARMRSKFLHKLRGSGRVAYSA